MVFHRGLQRQIVSLLGGEAVGVHHHFLVKCIVLHRQVGDDGAILCCHLCEIGKGRGYLHGIVRAVCAAGAPLTAGLLLFVQVWLRLDEMCLEFFWIQLGVPGATVFLKLACLRNESV